MGAFTGIIRTLAEQGNLPRAVVVDMFDELQKTEGLLEEAIVLLGRFADAAAETPASIIVCRDIEAFFDRVAPGWRNKLAATADPQV